jgi:hypothetical protein
MRFIGPRCSFRKLWWFYISIPIPLYLIIKRQNFRCFFLSSPFIVAQQSAHSFLSSRLSPSYARPVQSFLPLPRPVLHFHRLVVPSVLPLGCPRFPPADGATRREMDGSAGAGWRSVSLPGDGRRHGRRPEEHLLVLWIQGRPRGHPGWLRRQPRPPSAAISGRPSSSSQAPRPDPAATQVPGRSAWPHPTA